MKIFLGFLYGLTAVFLLHSAPINFRSVVTTNENASSSLPSSTQYIRPQVKSLPRIAIAGLGIESSTFSPALTNEEAFHPKYGADVFSSYRFFAVDSPLRSRAEWVPTLVGKSLPGGAVTREAYESLVNKILDSLKKHAPYDGLFLDIHGAMSVVGLDDPEGDFIMRIRKVIGKTTIISTSMDLHGNVSWRLAENTDLITCYRMAPHEDAMETWAAEFFYIQAVPGSDLHHQVLTPVTNQLSLHKAQVPNNQSSPPRYRFCVD